MIELHSQPTCKNGVSARERRSPQLLSALFEAIPVAVVCVDERGHIVECNAAACELFGYQHQEFLECGLEDLLPASSRGAMMLTDEPTLEPNLDELAWKRKGGQTFHATARRQALSGQRGQVWTWVESCRGGDCGLVEAARRLHDFRESERLRLARDLHDGVIQELIGMSFSLMDLKHHLERSSPDAKTAPVSRLQGDVTRIVRLLRALVSELRPAGLEEFGLRETLEGLIAQLVRDHSALRLEVCLDIQELPELTPPQELCLFRVAQEALQNCMKLSGATRVTLSLNKVEGEALLLIKDNGRGFDVPTYLTDLTRSQHYGLAGMLERVQLLDGHLSLHSRPQQGTEVRVSLKLEVLCV